MAEGPRYRVAFRRRREGKTDYKYRLRLLKGEVPRATVRVTNRRVLVSVEAFDPTGDQVRATADSHELVEIGFPGTSLTSTSAAYLTGYLAGLRSVAAGEGHAVLDSGLTHPTPGGRIMGALRGLLDAGMEIPHSDDGFPAKERIAGTHLKTPLSGGIDGMVTKLKAQPGRKAK